MKYINTKTTVRFYQSNSFVEVHTTLESRSDLRDAPALIVYNSNKEPIPLTHRNIVAAASALVLEYKMTSDRIFALSTRDKDVVLAEPVSIASTFSLLIATMLSGGQFSFTNRILEVCGSLQPTILSASNNSYFQIFNELFSILKSTPIATFLLAPLRRLLSNTQYFKYVRQRHISELLGDNLRLALSFYSYRPLSQDGHRLL